MLNNELLAKVVASYKKDSRKEFDKAVAALIALAWKYRRFGSDFLWDKDPVLNDEANRICRNLSDALAERAKLTAAEIMEDSLTDYDFDEAWDRESDEWYVPVLTRFDQQGSFLKELLEVWIAIAFVYGLSQGALLVEISRFLTNPFLSRYWKDLPRDILKWGSGYSKDIASQIAVIGQNSIIAAARYAEWQDAMANGASYYIRRRGSYYDCPDCDELCGYPIPIEQPFVFLHSHCMCFPEYHYEEMPL
jgi:hypothetical protein